MSRLLSQWIAVLVVTCGASSPARALDDCASPSSPMSLGAAEKRLFRCNRDVRAAAVALAAAVADRRVAGQRPNPTLTLGASNVNPRAGVGGGNLRDKAFDSSVRLEQLLERGGKAALREAQADALLEAARADLDEQLRQQRLQMRTAFFDLASAQERVRLQREFVDLANASAEASERRLAAGEISRAEANRFRLDALRAANELRQAQSERSRARLDLARLVGAERDAATLEAMPWWPEQEGAKRAGERPDVAAARLRVSAAEAASDLARSIAVRDVTVGLQADRWPVSETNLQGTGISYTLSVSLPLHVRHANEGEAQRAAADLDGARQALERAQAQSVAEATLAEDDWRNARERRDRVEKEVVPAAREVAAAAEFAYSRGATGVLDLLDARRPLKAVELDEVQARSEAAKAWARREAALETVEEGAR